MTRAEIIQTIERWGSGREDIRLVFLFGSCARGEDSRLSDIDVVVVCRDLQAYVARPEWPAAVGEPPILDYFQKPAAWARELFLRHTVFWAPGLVVEAMPVPVSAIQQLASGAAGPGAAAIGGLAGGIKVLVDKDGLGAAVEALAGRVKTSFPEAPDEPTFRNAVRDFWYSAYAVAEKVSSNDLWKGMIRLAHSRVYDTVLLALIQWHSVVVRRQDLSRYPHSYYGGNMGAWADPRVLERLAAGLPLEGGRAAQAVREMISLADELAREIATALGFAEEPSWSAMRAIIEGMLPR